MSERYDIFFAGKIAEGFEEAGVRAAVGKMFKANPATLEKLFSGKPQVIKRGVDKQTAIKYKAALQKAGAVPIIRASAKPQTAAGEEDLPSSKAIPKSAPAPAQEEKSGGTLADRLAAMAAEEDAAPPPAPAAAAEAPPATAADADSSLSLAPAGSDVLREDERDVVEDLDIDTSDIELADVGEDLLLEEAEAPPPAPDTGHLSMGGVGEDIPHLENEETPVDPDTSHLSMGEVGEDIPHLESEQEPLNPDTSDIELAPEGSDVLEDQYRKQDTASAPNTDHISLEP